MNKIHCTSLRVRYQETDQMGVVHHGNYLNWFEVGRTEWLREKGMNYSDIEKRGLLLPVTEVQLQYKQPAKYDDLIDVYTNLVSYSGIRMNFHYEVKRNGETLVCGTTYHCWTSRDLKPVHLKKVWPELHKFIQELEE